MDCPVKPGDISGIRSNLAGGDGLDRFLPAPFVFVLGVVFVGLAVKLFGNTIRRAGYFFYIRIFVGSMPMVCTSCQSRHPWAVRR